MTSKRSVLFIVDWYEQSTHRAVSEYARQAGWDLFTIGARSFYLPSWWKGDGVISLCSGSPSGLSQFISGIGRRTPVVDMANRYPKLRAVRVIPDEHRIGELAAEHFLERGFRHFAFIHNLDLWQEVGRQTGYQERLAQAGMEVARIQWRSQDGAADFAQAEIADIVALPKPLALFVMHDDVADRLMRRMVEEGINIPGDVALVSVNNDEFICDYAPVPLSSVDPDWYAVGWTAAETLQGLMEGIRAPQGPVLVPPKGMVCRASSDVFTTQDPVTAKALRYIHNNSHLALKASDVVAYVGVSHGTLLQRFHEHRRCSLNQQIIRFRLGRIKELLATRSLSGVEIARQLNFGRPKALYDFFRKHEGSSFGEYRRALRAAVKDPGRRTQDAGPRTLTLSPES